MRLAPATLPGRACGRCAVRKRRPSSRPREGLRMAHRGRPTRRHHPHRAQARPDLDLYRRPAQRRGRWPAECGERCPPDLPVRPPDSLRPRRAGELSWKKASLRGRQSRHEAHARQRRWSQTRPAEPQAGKRRRVRDRCLLHLSSAARIRCPRGPARRIDLWGTPSQARPGVPPLPRRSRGSERAGLHRRRVRR